MALDRRRFLTLTGAGAGFALSGSLGALYPANLVSARSVFPFGFNRLNDSEFAGATFSPDGRTLYVNIQGPGHTFAIYGPWQAFRGRG